MKPKKEELIKENTKLFKASGFNWQSFNNGYHWRVAGCDFYPTSEKWFDPKNDFRGYGTAEFINYVNRHEQAKKESVNVLTIEQLFNIAKDSKDKSLIGICAAIHREIYL